MNKKPVYHSNKPNGWWRQHSPEEEDTIIRVIEKNGGMIEYPTKEETEEAWNTLIGFCVSQWLPWGNYSHEELCDKLKIYLNLL